MKELRSLYQGTPMARQALEEGDIMGAKEILREMDCYLQAVLWTTETMPLDPGGAAAPKQKDAPFQEAWVQSGLERASGDCDGSFS